MSRRQIGYSPRSQEWSNSSAACQCGYCLFRYCGIPRWNHLVRCHPPAVSYQANELVDEEARRCLAKLAGGLDFGGHVFDNTLFTCDLLASIPFVDLAPLAYSACVDGIHSPEKAIPQNVRVRAHLEDVRKKWLSRATETSRSDASRVHLDQLSAQGSRLWLECRPNRGEYIMRLVDWEVAFRARYLVPPTNDDIHSCVCGYQCPSEDFVVHALDCNKVGGVHLGFKARPRERRQQKRTSPIQFPS
jgi:hypothetical protein